MLWWVVVGCAARTPTIPSTRSDAAAVGVTVGVEPIACCPGGALDAVDGKRVVIVGTYRPTLVAKRPSKPGGQQASDPTARTVAIDQSTGSVMLGIYYARSGLRPVSEVERFSGKRVRVVGTMHAHTPSQTVDAEVMQTMTGPYLSDPSITDAE